MVAIAKFFIMTVHMLLHFIKKWLCVFHVYKIDFFIVMS